MAAPKTTGQELSDLFYGLQITTKIIEGLMTEHSQGLRDQGDYENRFHSQIWLLSSNLKNVKPLIEKLITEGYSKYEQNTNSSNTTGEIHTGGSSELVANTQVQGQESGHNE